MAYVTPQTGLASKATCSTVPASVTTATLANQNRHGRGVSIINDSAATMYIFLGDSASSTVYTAQLGAGNVYEVPFNYIGLVTAVWDSATGNARVTTLEA